MTVLKKNKNIVAAFILFTVLTLILIQKNSIPQDFIEVTIVQGDTLSELAERYSGDTPTDRWMRDVVAMNNLTGSAIIAGEDIKLPIHSVLEDNDTRLVLAEESE